MKINKIKILIFLLLIPAISIASIKKSDYKIVPHHLYGYVETNLKYNAVKWLNDTNFKIKNILI